MKTIVAALAGVVTSKDFQKRNQHKFSNLSCWSQDQKRLRLKRNEV
jgi:hypothetical protein